MIGVLKVVEMNDTKIIKPIVKVLSLTREKYFEAHLSIVNSVLPIRATPREVEVLGIFMSLEGDIANDRFGTSARRIVKKMLKLDDGGLGNFLRGLRQKGFIILGPSNKEIINPLLSAEFPEQHYNFKIVLKDD